MQAESIPFPTGASGTSGTSGDDRSRRWRHWFRYATHDHWLRQAHQRLDTVQAQAPEIPFDHTTRIIFFADTHRGTKSAGDVFARNEHIFLQALDHYYGRGFTYIEVGDGDELWLNRQLAPIRRAYHDLFERLHRFAAAHRLHLLLGNHEIRRSKQARLHKGELEAVEGLLLRHRVTDQRLFVVHGHQADPTCDQFLTWSYYFTRLMDKIGMASEACYADVPDDEIGVRGRVLARWGDYSQGRVEARLRSWAASRRQILIKDVNHCLWQWNK